MTGYRISSCFLLAGLLAACGQTAQGPAAPAAERPAVAPQALLAEVRTAGSGAVDAFDVQPLRDPQVEDLLQSASRLEEQGDAAGAAARIDQALAIAGHDPEILQRRAEYALLLGDWSLAQQYAARSYETGPRLGPLCRRNWTTMRLVYEHAQDPAAAAIARDKVGECTVEPPVRM